jgi:hypothetical protein
VQVDELASSSQVDEASFCFTEKLAVTNRQKGCLNSLLGRNARQIVRVSSASLERCFDRH